VKKKYELFMDHLTETRYRFRVCCLCLYNTILFSLTKIMFGKRVFESKLFFHNTKEKSLFETPKRSRKSQRNDTRCAL